MSDGDFLLPPEERKARASRRHGRPTLGDLFDFDKLERVLQGKEDPAEVDVIQQVKDPLDYINRSLQAIEDKKCRKIVIAPPEFDISVMWNWIVFKGNVSEKAKDEGFDHNFFVNYSLLRAPCMIVRRSLLVRVNQDFIQREQEARSKNIGGQRVAHSLADLSFEGSNPQQRAFVASLENCCVAVDWDTNTFLTRATIPHPSVGLLKEKEYVPAHHVFRKIPKTDLALVPLQPKPTEEGMQLSIDFWDIDYDAEVVILEDANDTVQTDNQEPKGS